MLLGLLGTRKDIPIIGQPQTLIDCQSIVAPPSLKDRQGVHYEQPTSFVIRFDNGGVSPPGTADNMACRLEWGSGGGSSIMNFGAQAFVGSVATGGPFIQVLPMSVAIPVKASWVRLTAFANGFAAYTAGAHIAEGACIEPLIHRIIANGLQPAVGVTVTATLPRFARQFRIIPEAAPGPSGFTFSNNTIGLGGDEVTVPAGTVMDWMAANPYMNGNLFIRNDGPDAIVQINLDIEFDF